MIRARFQRGSGRVDGVEKPSPTNNVVWPLIPARCLLRCHQYDSEGPPMANKENDMWTQIQLPIETLV